MRYGIQLGKHFFGYTKALIGPFTENIEAGTPYRISGSFDDIMQILKGEYSDRSLIELFGCVAEIFAPVHAIASRVVAGNYQFKKKKSGEVIENNADLNTILSQPNPFQNFQELLYEAVVYELVIGKDFFYSNTPKSLKRMDYKNVFATYNLPGERITINTPEKIKLFSATKVSDVVIDYILDKDTDEEQHFPVQNVLHRKQINLDWKGRKIKGRSPLLSAEKAIANLIAVYEARNVVYIKRGRMGMWVSRKKDDSGMVALTDTEKIRAASDLDKEYGLSKKKQTVGLTSEPIDFVKTSMSIAELLPFEETAADAAAIYGVLDVPYELAPKPRGETYSNQMTAERGLYQNRVIPIAQSWCHSLSNFWNVLEADIYLDVTFDHLEVLQENKKEKSDRDNTNNKTWLQQFTNGIITLNTWVVNAGGQKVKNNGMYDKLIYEMSESELAIVKEILNIQKPGNTNNDQGNNNQNSQSTAP